DRAEVDGSAGELADRARALRAAPIEVLGREERADVCSVADGRERVLQCQPDRVHLRRQARAHPLDEAERLERRDALRRRPELEHAHTVELERERLDPAPPPTAQVLPPPPPP